MERIIEDVVETYNEIKEDGEMVTYGEDRTPMKDMGITSLKDLYRYGIRTYGKCVSKIFEDGEKGKTIHTGYVFESREKYQDCDKTYIRHVWLSIEKYREIIQRERIPIQ